MNAERPVMTVAPDVYRELIGAARAALPNEACGLLAGDAATVTRFYPMTNADADPRHFSMLPAEQFAAVRDIRARGLRLLGIWHSHPTSPAAMSTEDLRLAFTPGTAYFILSLQDPDAPHLSGFVVKDGVPEAVETEIVER